MIWHRQVTISRRRTGFATVFCVLNLFSPRTESLQSFLPYQRRPSSSLFATVDVWEGPWSATPKFLEEYWGQKPLLVRRAFDASTSPFPSWYDIVNLAVDDDTGYAARLVQHTAGDLTSFSLDLGPFDPDELDDALDDRSVRTTLLVNDVDRRRADLADWMEAQFAFLPRWRMDDAQISIAQKGGGIGPHVDNYDVFLIQTAGQREWKVGLDKLSTAEEYAALVPDIPVRILQKEFDAVAYVLEPGDMLYLPPRVIHCGTAASDQCVTLSVGCRAPSAADLIARMAEQLQDTATERYQDVNLSELTPSDVSLTTQVKERMKQMTLRAIQTLLKDDAAWDALVGGIITEPIRDDDLGAFDEDEDDYMGENSEELLQSSNIYLKRSPGVSVATSTVEISGQPASRLHRLFAHGTMWESNESLAREIFHHIEQGLPLTSEHLKAALTSPVLKSVLEELVQRRLLRIHRRND
ncbi:hypothetical protein FisN_20Hh192 [Fistulifera solaris]|uniref:Bifunctional lysine-specific demethylase and histidyl-hydroxylase n=1 Tax=Fistulifera solaris TaxID=1519565 RepID=A0A1Z5JJU2_FISSO|nr:hypothetical protein FisN_20Hh192 [Fistulifera solaris]|eukprot:GAX14186.1 hypothetical protein FisN_20Hh192 [Fistulifera solaris]